MFQLDASSKSLTPTTIASLRSRWMISVRRGRCTAVPCDDRISINDLHGLYGELLHPAGDQEDIAIYKNDRGHLTGVGMQRRLVSVSLGVAS